MIDNYDDATVDETLDAVSDFSTEEKVEFLQFERENKNRTGVIEPLEADLPDGAVPEAESDDDAEPDVSATAPLGDEVTVTVDEYGYAAGLWFDNADETKTVERTTRITRAIENGELEVVD